jgi:hypothetical protein
MSADRPASLALELAEIRASLERLHRKVDALHRGREGLNEGRCRAIQKRQKAGAYTRALVVELAAADAAAGLPAWGRGRRIADKLGARVSASQVRRILRTLCNAREESGQDGQL